MTEKERKEEKKALELLIKDFYLYLALAQKQYPDDKVLIDRILDNINDAKKILKD